MIQLDTSLVQRWGGLLASEVQAVAVRIQPAVGDEAAVVTSRAQGAAPMLTGALKGSIRPVGRGLRWRVRAGGGKTYYGRFQEFGTRKMAAHPFLLKQANATTHAEFEQRVDRALGRGEVYR